MDVIKGHGHANQWLGPSIAVRGQQGQSSSRFFDATLAMRGWPSIGEADSLAVSESPFQKTSTATRVHFYCSPLGLLGWRSGSVINRTGLASRSIDPTDVFGMIRRRFCVNSGVMITSPSRLIIK